MLRVGDDLSRRNVAARASQHDLVQSIKLAEQIMGRGSERVRPPRWPLSGERRRDVTARVERCAATRPGRADGRST